ncbi:abortive infection protein [Frateuria sp. Soil773]|uniref:CPBP family intramembrane glutamic endopeptidase n=1 Tax=Frateuria sp. Soil773 TaxID=1736407 RepID=UPI0007004DF8|nr:CPBP family intramembrane glutamic endopeptidase [Frateuria sp. Soil773]KRE88361.1 abortive infection protein [Frateuria sp. Soil773]
MEESSASTFPPRHVRVPGIGGALCLILLYFLLQLVVSGLLGLLLGLAVGLYRGNLGTAGFQAQLQAELSRPDTGVVLVILTLLVAATLTLWLARRCWPGPWAMAAPPGFGLNRRGPPAYYALAVLFGLAMPVLGGWLTQWLAHGHQVTQDVKQLGGASSLALRIPLALLVVSAGPLVEELLFRGVLLSALLRRMPAGGAMAVSSLLFAAVHLPDLNYLWYAVPNLALLAAVLAWLRLRSGSLWPSVLAHGVNNLLAVAAWFVALPPGH